MKTKKCGRCQEEKPMNDFGSNKSRKDGKNVYCNMCLRKFYPNIYSKERSKEAAAKNPDYYRKKRRESAYRILYGISLNEYNSMLEYQNHVCAICKNPPSFKILQVDHDHTTGKVRGLLCGKCNTALGSVNDDIKKLRLLIQYLEKYS